MNEAEYLMKNYGTLQDLHYSSYDTKAKFNTQETLDKSQLGSNLVLTWEIIIPNFQSWVILGAKLGFTLRVKCSTYNSQYMFPKLDPKLASSAYYIGDNLGLHKLICTFFGAISSKHIFYGSKLGHAHPNINCFGV